MGANAPDLSVLVATRDRGPVLRATLASFARVHRDGLRVEFAVIDNGSRDDTPEVLREWESRLPLRALREPRAGKNAALNRALDELELAPIVVFTDDDVDPDPGWLLAIADACARRPEHAVFGGPIRPVWPPSGPPEWALDPSLLALCFGVHHYGSAERAYTDGALPFGANFWVRRDVLADHRYDEAVGPRPRGRTMGSETALLLALVRDGHEVLHVPGAVVGHRIAPGQLSESVLLRRAWRLGRGDARVRGVFRADLAARHPWIWRLLRAAGLARACGRLLRARLRRSSAARAKGSAEAVYAFARNLESLRIRSGPRTA